MSRLAGRKVELFQAWITVDYERLPEYDPVYDLDTNTWTCWIPSVEGKRFVVHWRNFGNRTTSGAYVSVDGEFADGKLLMKSNGIQSTSVNGKRTASASIAPFEFQKITLTDEENPFILEDDAIVSAIGEIKVVIHLGKNAGTFTYRHGEVREPRAVNERTKKAGGHRVQYGTRVEDIENTGAKFRPDPQVTPLTFIFKYRPRDMLQAMGIIDRGQTTDGLGRINASTRRSIKSEPNVKDEADVKQEPRDPPPSAGPSSSRPRTRARVKSEE